MKVIDATVYVIGGIMILFAPLFMVGMALDQDDYWRMLDTFVIVFGPVAGVVVLVLWKNSKK